MELFTISIVQSGKKDELSLWRLQKELKIWGSNRAENQQENLSNG